MRLPFRVCAVLGTLVVATITLSAQQQPLVQPGQLVWDGAFRLPHDNGDYLSSFAYGTYALGYDTATGRLYVACHAEGRQIGQVSIPTPSKSTTLTNLPIATRTQPCVDITEGRYTQIGGYPKWYPGGLIMFGGRLIESMWSYFDSMDPTAAAYSHFTHSPTLNASGTVTGPHRLQGYTVPGTPGFVAGYMALVPQEWQAALGGPALTGQCCIPIAVRSSWGPNAIAFDPSKLGAIDPVPATTLLNYPQDQPRPNTDWTGQSEFYNLSTYMGGMFIPSGTRSLLYVGRQGTGPGSYRSGVDPYCGDGLNAPPYQLQVWAYDLNDLAAVKAGTKKPWDLRPYAYGSQWKLTSNGNPVLPFVNNCMYIHGLGHDPATNRIWIATGFPKAGQLVDGDYSVIHQFHVAVGSTPATFTVSPQSLSASSAAENFTVTVTASDQTAGWVASSNQAWATVNPTSGTGSGSVAVAIAANPTSSQRTATLTIAGQSVAVTQAAGIGPICTFSVAPTSLSVGSAGGQNTVNVTASDPTCGWTATGTSALTVSPTSGTGSRSVTLTTSANTATTPRTLTAVIAGRSVTVTQSAAQPTTGTYAVEWSLYAMPSPTDEGAQGNWTDSQGNVYIAGGYQGTGFTSTLKACGDTDTMLAKYSPTGALIWSRCDGGPGRDYIHSVVVDSAGNVYASGVAYASGFPVTTGAYQTTWRGVKDVIVMKLSPAGALLWATYLGGSGDEHDRESIALDAAGNVVVAGATFSADFPTTVGAYRRTIAGSQDGFIAKLSSDGRTLLASTFFGGSGNDTLLAGVGVASDGSISAAGWTNSTNIPTTASAFQRTYGGGTEDALLVKFDGSLSSLLYATYLGGSGADRACENHGAVYDSTGRAYIGGYGDSTNLPTTATAFQRTKPGGFDQFVAILSANGSTLQALTYLGGPGDDLNSGIIVNGSGLVAVAGETTAAGYPLASAIKTAPTAKDAVISVLSPDLSQLVFSTYYGGSADDRARGVAAYGNRFIMGGDTNSTNYPVTNGSTNRGARDFLLTSFIAGVAPPVCSFSVSPLSLTLPAAGGSGTVNVTTSDQTCGWTATGSGFATVSPQNGTGDGAVTITAPAYTGTTARTVNVTVAGRQVSVTQTGLSCSFTVAMSGNSFPVTGGSLTATVTASNSACGWSITGVPNWIQPSATSGTGSGTVTLTAPDLSRAGSLVIAGTQVNVSQP